MVNAGRFSPCALVTLNRRSIYHGLINTLIQYIKLTADSDEFSGSKVAAISISRLVDIQVDNFNRGDVKNKGLRSLKFNCYQMEYTSNISEPSESYLSQKTHFSKRIVDH